MPRAAPQPSVPADAASRPARVAPPVRPSSQPAAAPQPTRRVAASPGLAPTRRPTDEVGVAVPRSARPAPALTPPPGYEAAWTDGRLNQDRGKQLLSGALQTSLVWTQTVPRRLIDRRTGADVTSEYHLLVYPYTDYDKQIRDLRGGEKIVVRTRGGERQIVSRDRLGTNAAGQTVLSTKAAPQRSHDASGTEARAYVQVGTYGRDANARRTVTRLRELGLPVSVSRTRLGGQSVQVVLAGPFADRRSTGAALSTVRRAGYSDAFTR